jgi:hypothetical protein
MNKKKIEKESELDEMLPEYDFTGQKGVRGRYYQAYRQGHTVKIHKPDGSVSTQYLTLEDGAVMLEQDLRAYFPTAESVNTALRALVSLIPTKAAKAKTGTKSGKARRMTEKKRFSPAQNIRDAQTEYKIRDAKTQK